VYSVLASAGLYKRLLLMLRTSAVHVHRESVASYVRICCYAVVVHAEQLYVSVEQESPGELCVLCTDNVTAVHWKTAEHDNTLRSYITTLPQARHNHSAMRLDTPTTVTHTLCSGFATVLQVLNIFATCDILMHCSVLRARRLYYTAAL
jgi:hypothetical protein